jgi:hypothetical protein
MGETESKAEKRAKATAARAGRGLAKVLGGSARKRAMLMVEHTARLNMGARVWLGQDELHYLQESFKTPDERILLKRLMEAEEAQRLQLLAARAALSELMEYVEKYAGSWTLKKNLEAMTINLNNLLDIFNTSRSPKIKVKQIDVSKPGANEKLIKKNNQSIINQRFKGLHREALRKILNEFKGPHFKFRFSLADPHNPIKLDESGGGLNIDRELEDIRGELYKAQDKLKTILKVNRDLLAAHKVKIKPYEGLINEIDKYAGVIGRLRGLDIRPWENAEINQALYNQLAANISTWKPVGRGR